MQEDLRNDKEELRRRAKEIGHTSVPGEDFANDEHEQRHEAGILPGHYASSWGMPVQHGADGEINQDNEIAQVFFEKLTLVQDIIEEAGETIPDITDLQSLREMATRYRDQIIQRNKMKR